MVDSEKNYRFDLGIKGLLIKTTSKFFKAIGYHQPDLNTNKDSVRSDFNSVFVSFLQAVQSVVDYSI